MRPAHSRRSSVGLALAAAGVTAAAAWLAGRRHAYSFRDRTVLITGGSRGLGLVLARQFASEGAGVALVARDAAELDRAAENVRANTPGAQILTVPADVTDRSDVERAVAQTMQRFGDLDVVINNAGVIQVGPFEHMQLADYDNAMQTHFWGPLYLTLAALPHMRRRGGGRIVNISSIGGRIAVPHLLPYSASKFALVGLSDGLRVELLSEDILVTTVCPGLMRTGSAVQARFKGRHEEEFAWFAAASSLPLATVSAERAGRQIVAACRRGDAELIIGIQANLAVMARTLAPELFSGAMSLVRQALPAPDGPGGDANVSGRAVARTHPWTSALLAPARAAAVRNNELP